MSHLKLFPGIETGFAIFLVCVSIFSGLLIGVVEAENLGEGSPTMGQWYALSSPPEKVIQFLHLGSSGQGNFSVQAQSGRDFIWVQDTIPLIHPFWPEQITGRWIETQPKTTVGFAQPGCPGMFLPVLSAPVADCIWQPDEVILLNDGRLYEYYVPEGWISHRWYLVGWGFLGGVAGMVIIWRVSSKRMSAQNH